MPIPRSYHHRPSLRATGLTALLTLIAPCATACIFIGEIDVDGGTSPGDDKPGVSHASHGDDDEPCGDTEPHETEPGSDTTEAGEAGEDGEDGEAGEAGEDGEAEPTPTEAIDDLPNDPCGNGEPDLAEACDDGVNNGDHGGCMPGCGALAPFCGDFLTNGPESCDDGNLIDDDECTQLCQPPHCGDGLLQQNEQCDGTARSGATCVSLGFAGGQLDCDPAECTFDVQSCFACGDGHVDAGEACDGAELAGATCESLGLGAGVLACDAMCGLDTSGCVESSVSTGDCCVAGPPGSCSLPEIEACVCEQVPECCDLAWSDVCVAVASETCSAQCP